MTALEKPSLIGALARTYEMDPAEFYRVVKATIMPGDATQEQTAAFLMVAKEYGLSPMLKEIHAFKNRKTGGVVPVISIDGWSTMVNRHPAFDGVEFEYDNGETGVTSITCKIWRNDRTRPIMVTEFMTECRRETDAWNLTPSRMLRHRAYIQCARLAFGFSGAFDEETVEAAASGPIDVTPADKLIIDQAKPRPPSAPKRAAPQQHIDVERPKPAEKPAGREQAAPEKKATGETTDAFVERFIARLKQCLTIEDIDMLVEEMDVEAQLTGDEDALEMAEMAVVDKRDEINQAAS